MCDPLVGGLIAGAGALFSGAQAASQQQALMDTQNQANDQWVAYQNKIRQDQMAEEDKRRKLADQAREDTLAKVSPEAQTQAQTTEQQRLNTLYTQPAAGSLDPNSPSSLALSGQDVTGNKTFKDSLTENVNSATSLARGRIAALATAGSYGGSFGGLGTTVPIDFTQGGNQIQMQNDIRNADLKTYGVEQQVQPVNYAMGPGTDMGGISKALGGIAGTLVGNAKWS
jgi:hypothetical protein